MRDFEVKTLNGGLTVLNVVSLGGGVNSAALIIGMEKNEVPIDLILFADTGCEMPHTYEFVYGEFSQWLALHSLPPVTTVRYAWQDGKVETLEQELLRLHNLPPPAYGGKSCSEKYKIRPQEKYCEQHPDCIKAWQNGEMVNKYIGYDAGEPQRKSKAIVYDMLDKKYNKFYPLIDDWDWDREKCVEVIQKEGLPLPGKSSCFFCPNLKNDEIRMLHREYPEMMERAIAIERNAKEKLTHLNGLGRDWSWEAFIENEYAQSALCGAFTERGMPCGCYDG